jgi:hypothetical protein
VDTHSTGGTVQPTPTPTPMAAPPPAAAPVLLGASELLVSASKLRDV